MTAVSQREFERMAQAVYQQELKTPWFAPVGLMRSINPTDYNPCAEIASVPYISLQTRLKMAGLDTFEVVCDERNNTTETKSKVDYLAAIREVVG
jgi:hypothetical protein